MRITLTAVLVTILITSALGQSKEKEKLLKEIAEGGCKCIDSISVYNKAKEEVSSEVARCIDNRVDAYQLGVKMIDLDDKIKNAKADKDGNKNVELNLSFDKDSKEYKASYFEIERYLMNNCKSLKEKIAARDKQSLNSLSQNKEALDKYESGVKEMKKENFKKAISAFSKAVKIDKDFAFAWDNLGLCYRKLGDYDAALNAYQKSLEIDPKGQMPLQNIAIVYQYKKDYPQAIKAYEMLAEVDKNNPEVYYGLGKVYSENIGNFEAGLRNMCKAYNLYIEQKSPYRTDAEKVIQQIYGEMKKQGKEGKFNEILKANHINPK